MSRGEPSRPWRMEAGDFDQNLPAPNELFVFCLTDWQRSVLLAWLHHLAYRASWGDMGEPEWSDVKSALEAMIVELVGGDSLASILSLFEQILQEIGSVTTQSGGCVTYNNGVVVYVDGVDRLPYGEPVPRSVIDSGWASDEGDTSGMSNYLCASADLVIDGMLWKVDQLQELYRDGLLAVGAVAALLGYVFTGGAGAVVAALLANAVAVYDSFAGITDEAFDQIREAIEGMRGTVRCAMKNGATPAGVLAAVRALAIGLPFPLGVIVENLGWEPVIRAVYDGVDQDGNPIPEVLGEPEPCAAVCEVLGISMNVLHGTVVSDYVSGSPLQRGQLIRLQSVQEVIGLSVGHRVTFNISGLNDIALVGIKAHGGDVYPRDNEAAHYYQVGESGDYVYLTSAEVEDGFSATLHLMDVRSSVSFTEPVQEQFLLDVLVVEAG